MPGLRSPRNKIIVLGCSRSGTTWLSDVLRYNSYFVAHEENGMGGGVGFMLLHPSQGAWKDENADVYHLIRNPYDCIPSMATHYSDYWPKADVIVGGCSSDIVCPYTRAASVWVRMGRLCMTYTNKVVRTESMVEDLESYGVPLPDVPASANLNSRRDNPDWPQYRDPGSESLKALECWDEVMTVYESVISGRED